MDPQRWGALQERHAFTLAVATDTTLLEKVKEAIRRSLQTEPSVTRGKLEIQSILNHAGVSHLNPVYSELVYRTNAMDAFNAGWSRELAEPDVAETFPVWRYANPQDNRSRPTHAARAGKYYSAPTPFAEVRGLEAKDAIFCRCTGIPISKWEWAKLQQQGKRVEETTARFSEEELGVITIKPNPEWPLIEAGAWEAFTEDKNKHEHAGKGTEKGGQFTSKGKGDGSDKGKVGKESSPEPIPQTPEQSTALHTKAHESSQAIIKKSNGVLAKVGAAGKAMKSATQKVYKALEQRYGRNQAIAIFAAGTAIGIASPLVVVPGSSIIGMVPFAAMAEIYLQSKKAFTKSSKFSEALSDEQIMEMGKQLAEQLKAQWEEIRKQHVLPKSVK